MLLLGLCYYWKVVVCHIQIFNCVFTSDYGIYRMKSLKHNLFSELLLIDMSHTDIPILFPINFS